MLSPLNNFSQKSLQVNIRHTYTTAFILVAPFIFSVTFLIPVGRRTT